MLDRNCADCINAYEFVGEGAISWTGKCSLIPFAAARALVLVGDRAINFMGVAPEGCGQHFTIPAHAEVRR